MKPFETVNGGRQRAIAMALLACGIAMLSAPLGAHAAGCGTVIPISGIDCNGGKGIIITAPGCYLLSSNQTNPSATSDCIVIKSPSVTLNLANTVIQGTGAKDTGRASMCCLPIPQRAKRSPSPT